MTIALGEEILTYRQLCQDESQEKGSKKKGKKGKGRKGKVEVRFDSPFDAAFD